MEQLKNSMDAYDALPGWRKFLIHLPYYIKSIPHKIKMGLQRMFRGYDDMLLFNLCHNITDLSLAALRYMRFEGHGHPSILTSDDLTWEESRAEWEAILDVMIRGFEAQKQQGEETDIEKIKALQSCADEGLKLFAKYYQNLWD